MAGLEHLFSGLVQGVGETKLSLEKEKREKEQRDKTEKLQLMTSLLSLPGVKPEMRSQLFKQALEVASDGDKKIVENMSGLLGPILAQSGGETGGVRTPAQGEAAPKGDSSPAPKAPQPAQAAPPATAGLPKFGGAQLGSSGSGGASRSSIFYSPEEETEQMAQRAGAVTKATAGAQSEVDMEAYKQKLALESEQKKKEGWSLTGFTSPDKVTGLSAAIYQNPYTQQVKIGEAQVPHILTAEGLSAIAVNEAQREQARQEAIRNIAVADAKDPSNITPAEMKAAEKKWATLMQQATNLGLASQKAGIFKDIATGTAALDRSVEEDSLTLQQQSLDYNRQRDDYERQGGAIQGQIDMVEKEKQQASEAYNAAMAIKEYLLQKKVREGVDQPDSEDLEQGYTWAQYHQLLGQAEAALGRARNAAQNATGRFGPGVEAGGFKKGEWPYLKDVRGGFQYQPMGGAGLPAMPTQGGTIKSKSKSGARKSSAIDVPASLLHELGLQ